MTTRSHFSAVRSLRFLALAACLCLLWTALGVTPARANAEAAQGCSAILGQAQHNAGAVLPQPIRILSWNIQKSGTLGWRTDLSKWGADKHLLLLQEASTQADINGALPLPLYQAFAAGYVNDGVETGVMTLSTVAPTLQCNLTAWEPWLGTPKATNITEYPLAGTDQRLLVINLHAVNFAVGLTEFTDQVEALAPLLKSHPGPLLVAGDFNTWSAARQGVLTDFMDSHALQAVDFKPDYRTTFWNRPLDHIYLRRLRVLEARSIRVDTSDHNPLQISVEISP